MTKAEKNTTYLEEIKHEILNYYQSLDESKKDIFNMYMIGISGGVDYDDEFFLLGEHNVIKEIYKIIHKISVNKPHESITLGHDGLQYLLGYKKIVWLQGKIASKELMCFKKIQESITQILSVITRLDNIAYENSEGTLSEIEDAEYIIYDKSYELAGLKLIEIINNSNGYKRNNRNETAIGLLLGYIPERVIKWTFNYDEKDRTIFFKELCNGDMMNDLLNLFDMLFNNKPITSGILAGISLPTVTKFKNVLDVELTKIINKKSNKISTKKSRTKNMIGGNIKAQYFDMYINTKQCYQPYF